MGWRTTTGRDRDGAGKPIQRFRVTADGEGGGLSPEQEQVLRRGMLGAAVADGLITEADLPSWQRHAEADLHGMAELLAEMRTARRGTPNGDMATASAPRREPDGERLIAGAISGGKFAASRAAYWRERFRRDPQQTEAIIESLQPLPPLRAAADAALRVDDGASVVGSVSPAAALRLGYSVQRPHPLGDNLPPRVQMPPPSRRTHVISDRRGSGLREPRAWRRQEPGPGSVEPNPSDGRGWVRTSDLSRVKRALSH
jgi:hypothetical protein